MYLIEFKNKDNHIKCFKDKTGVHISFIKLKEPWTKEVLRCCLTNSLTGTSNAGNLSHCKTFLLLRKYFTESEITDYRTKKEIAIEDEMQRIKRQPRPGELF